MKNQQESRLGLLERKILFELELVRANELFVELVPSMVDTHKLTSHN